MKFKLLLLAAVLVITVSFTRSTAAQSQPETKTPAIYADISFGYGRTIFFGRLANEQATREARGFSPSSGFNAAFFFYVQINAIRGLGVGGGGKGFTAGRASGGDNEEFFFNYYHFGASARYHFLTQRFNDGPYVKANLGFGQFTQKTRFNASKTYEHQFAIGTVVLIGAGYSFPVSGTTAINVFAEYEYASRNGDVTGEGQGISFQNGQLSLNAGISF
ncbi:MAG: hypothetical protein IAF08_03530 [Rhizobacter sp.]|nr:hypothetical protein [Chlorobiales bacterium]